MEPKARFFYKATRHRGSDGVLHFDFEVPHALGPGIPFTRHTDPSSEAASQADLESAIEACRRVLDQLGVPYTLEQDTSG